MTDEGPEQVGSVRDDAAGEPVGSVGEEAAKLFAALAGAAREEGGQYAGAAAGIAAAVSGAARDVDEHLATGSAECTWCPVCRVVHAVRQTSPEVRQHLAVAAGALAQAAAGLLATDVPGRSEGRPRSAPVETIDLDDEPGGPGSAEGRGDGSPGHP